MEETTERESANETSSVGDLQPAADVDHHPENRVPPLVNHEVTDSKCKISDKEITGIIEVIAATGRFWHDWDTLKSLLSCRLKQVLAEYPESEIAASPESPQSSLSGKIYPELVKRLDEELLSFIEGPPFTLQRLCEILLTARHIYPNLSKLALALEKNLLVTSTLSMSTDPYPGAVAENRPQDSQQTVHGIGDEHIQNQSDPVQNGVSRGEGDADQEMAEAEANEDNVNSDVKMKEDKIAETSESGSELNTDSNPSTEPSTDMEHVTS